LTGRPVGAIYVNVIYIHEEDMTLTDRLDDYGKPAWIAAAIAGFIIWWPLGLALLAYMIGSGRMGCWSKHGLGRWKDKGEQFVRSTTHGFRSSGNRAFDDYKAETLQRLEEEQKEFVEFLERLRQSKDKAEFDQFMAERAGRSNPTAESAA
jgi:hypothetical protein